jgi:putative FmdB family regulatory protein
MPTYEYRCQKGHTFDVFQRVTEDPIATCQVCGKPVQRVFHPPAVHFKGKGFYNTDYGTRNRQRELAAAGEGSSKEGKSDSGSADSSKSDSGGGSDATKKDKAGGSSSAEGSSSASEKKSDKPKADSKKSKPASKPA